jgi:hypothetical protein
VADSHPADRRHRPDSRSPSRSKRERACTRRFCVDDCAAALALMVGGRHGHRPGPRPGCGTTVAFVHPKAAWRPLISRPGEALRRVRPRSGRHHCRAAPDQPPQKGEPPCQAPPRLRPRRRRTLLRPSTRQLTAAPRCGAAARPGPLPVARPTVGLRVHSVTHGGAAHRRPRRIGPNGRPPARAAGPATSPPAGGTAGT